MLMTNSVRPAVADDKYTGQCYDWDSLRESAPDGFYRAFANNCPGSLLLVISYMGGNRTVLFVGGAILEPADPGCWSRGYIFKQLNKPKVTLAFGPV